MGKSGTSIETLNFYNLYPIYIYPETTVLQKLKVKKLLCSHLLVSLEKYDSFNRIHDFIYNKYICLYFFNRVLDEYIHRP